MLATILITVIIMQSEMTRYGGKQWSQIIWQSSRQTYFVMVRHKSHHATLDMYNLQRNSHIHITIVGAQIRKRDWGSSPPRFWISRSLLNTSAQLIDNFHLSPSTKRGGGGKCPHCWVQIGSPQLSYSITCSHAVLATKAYNHIMTYIVVFTTAYNS